ECTVCSGHSSGLVPAERLLVGLALVPPSAALSAPVPAAVARLVFGAGPHTCPGARLARTQLADLLAALAPYRPVVVRARPDRRAALPAWRTLTVRPGPTPVVPRRMHRNEEGSSHRNGEYGGHGEHRGSDRSDRNGEAP
ncbi:cytochrome P450, partial [Streptomyces sp. NPDC006992]